VSDSKALSVCSASAALPCHNSDRASNSLAASPPPRLTAARAKRSPSVILVSVIASRAAVTNSETSAVWSLSIVNSANRIRADGVVNGCSLNARTSSPRKRREAAIPRRRRMTSRNSGWLNRTSMPWWSSATRISPRDSASSTASSPTILDSL